MDDFIYKSYFTEMQVKTDMKDKIRVLLTVGVYHAFNDGSVVIIPILFPVFKTLFDLSYTHIGIITGGGLLITLITQIFIGAFSDKRNRRMLLSIGILILSGSLLLITQVQGFLTLLLFIFLLRFAAGFFHPTGVGWISKIFKKERIDWAMGIQSALGDFGAFIAILTSAFIVEIKDWSYPFYIWAIIGVLCLLLGLSLTRNTKDKYLINMKNSSTKSNYRNLLFVEREILKKIKLFLPGAIISGSAWGIVVSYLPLLLDERTALSLSAIGVIISIWIGVGAIVCIFYGKIISFFGRRNVIILSYAAMGFMGLSLTIFTNIIILIIIMILLGISSFLTFPAIFSYVSEKTDEAYEGKVFGYIFTVQLGGGTLILFLCGVTADLWGIWTPFFILGVSSLLIAILLMANRKIIIPANV
jgi:FSR family fosmidomycin resistance protein-like MFS transporter